jgi:flagellar hook-associated protein 3 FlgL
MVTTIDGSAEKFLTDLDRIQANAERAQRQLSSGLKVEHPSDAPDQIRDIVRLRAEVHRNAQIQTNLSSVKAQVDAADGALASAITVLDKAVQVGAQGAGSIRTASDRLVLAQQAEGLLQQLVGLSRTAVAGRFVFSGDSPEKPAYELDLTNPAGVKRLLTITATRQIEDVSGVSFAVSKTAQDLFDNRNPDDTLSADNVFAAVNGLQAALSNNDEAGINASLDALHRASDYLNLQVGFYGAAQNKIQDGLDRASKFQVQQSQDLSNLQDADAAAAALELTQSQTHLNASLSARAKLPRTSLFDFLA